MNNGNSLEKRKAAITVAISLLVMTVISIVAFGVLHDKIFSATNPDSLFKTIVGAQALLNIEILIWLVILILDIIVAWGLYVFLIEVDKSLSLLGAWFRLLYSCILGIGIFCLVSITALTNNPMIISAFETGQIGAQIIHLENSFQAIWGLGLIIFGVHLLIVGMLTYQSKYMPNWLAIIIFVAGVGYIIVNVMYAFIPSLDNLTQIIEYIWMIPMALGEVLLAIWLLVKGKKV